MSAPPSNDPTPIDGWKPLLLRLGAGADDAIDRVRRRFERRFRPDRRLHVVAYRGFGNAESCTLSGRVLAYREPPDGDPDSLWHTLQTSYRRFETDEVPDVTVVGRALVGGRAADDPVDGDPADGGPTDGGPDGGPAREGPAEGRPVETRSDAEGYFTLELPTPAGFDGTRLAVSLSLPEHADAVQDGVAEVVLPGPAARFGVISDIDDTVLVTQATSLLRMMRLTLLESSESRVAFPGVAEFYGALHGGTNPFFYVSSSPWNLYEFLEDFMALKGIVPGPMLLRDFGIDRDKLVAGPHLAHKLGQIRRVLDRYPALPFVLIGDSGQHDPEVYRDIVAEYPGRILAIYIRDVSEAMRDVEVQHIVDALDEAGVDMLLVPDTLAAAHHAAGRGWLDEAALGRVAAGVEAARAPHTALDEQRA